MSRAIEGSNQPEPGQVDTVTITTKEYALLTEIASTVVRMGEAWRDREKPKNPVGFQPPHTRFDAIDTPDPVTISVIEPQS